MLSHSTLSWDEPGDPIFLNRRKPYDIFFYLWKDKLMCTKKFQEEYNSKSWSTYILKYYKWSISEAISIIIFLLHQKKTLKSPRLYIGNVLFLSIDPLVVLIAEQTDPKTIYLE